MGYIIYIYYADGVDERWALGVADAAATATALGWFSSYADGRALILGV